MKQLSFLAIILLLLPHANATVNYSASFKGDITIGISTRKMYRHSGDCNLTEKGDDVYTYKDQVLALNGGKQVGGNQDFVWNSDMSDPFARNIRSLKLTTVSNINQLSEQVSLKLEDNYAYLVQKTYEGRCEHTNGITKPLQANLEGSISVEYTVPENVWALRIDRSGKGLLNRTNMKPVRGVLNEGYDKALSSTEIFWVRPGSKIIQEIIIPPSTPGNSDLGDATITFTPAAKNISTEKDFSDAISYLENYRNTIDKATNQAKIEEASLLFVSYASGILLRNENFAAEASKRTSQQLATLSKSLFVTANEINRSASLGLAVKTAAALASFETAIRLLTDLSVYCDEVEVHLPFANKNVKVLGLRAAGFWLSRGLSTIKNYRFDQYKALLHQLNPLESSRITYAQVRKDKATLKKIQSAYDFLTESIDTGGSPFGVALKDVQRTLKQFGTIGANSTETQSLVKQLTEINRMETEFVREFFKSLDNFPAESNEIVQVTRFEKQLEKIELAQKSLSLNMETNIRLLSINNAEESNSVMRVMTEVLSNQISIFEEQFPDLPYFEKVRSAYLENKNRSAIINKARQCVMGNN